jgi:hypothetical protein
VEVSAHDFVTGDNPAAQLSKPPFSESISLVYNAFSCLSHIFRRLSSSKKVLTPRGYVGRYGEEELYLKLETQGALTLFRKKFYSKMTAWTSLEKASSLAPKLFQWPTYTET